MIDLVGKWTELKLEILRAYIKEYTKILNKQSYFKFIYIDAFSSSGIHKSRETGEFIQGSPLIALNSDIKFSEYYFIDLDEQKLSFLNEQSENRTDVHLCYGDCNRILPEIISSFSREKYYRGLILLDPYKINLKWSTVEAVSKKGIFDVMINFMISDAQRNGLLKNYDQITENQKERISEFWGNEDWLKISYKEEKDLFGTVKKKQPSRVIADGYKKRLETVFSAVTTPIPMKNSNNAILYYLYLASEKDVAVKIANHIFEKYSKMDNNNGV